MKPHSDTPPVKAAEKNEPRPVEVEDIKVQVPVEEILDSVFEK